VSRPRPRVVVYTRARCGLCRRAEALVAREARRAEVHHVDVDADPALVARYGVRVPVVEVDGVEVAELELAPGTVRRAVRSARRRHPDRPSELGRRGAAP
jgi:glutaredoxin